MDIFDKAFIFCFKAAGENIGFDVRPVNANKTEERIDSNYGNVGPDKMDFGRDVDAWRDRPAAEV